MSRIVGVIPSRYGSTRFPGKSLAPICGKPLISWVVQRCQQARQLDAVMVATDDERIADVVRALGVDVCMTDSTLPSGTDRVAAALEKDPADVVVNVQGDEPLVSPTLIDAIADTLRADTPWDMATASTPIEDDADIENPSIVKVVTGSAGRALYFSRAAIPHDRDGEKRATYFRHVGIYGYRRAFLDKLVAAPPSDLEKIEKLEQLRALHIGCHMKVIETDEVGIGVDTPEDVKKAEAAIRAAGLA